MIHANAVRKQIKVKATAKHIPVQPDAVDNKRPPAVDSKPVPDVWSEPPAVTTRPPSKSARCNNTQPFPRAIPDNGVNGDDVVTPNIEEWIHTYTQTHTRTSAGMVEVACFVSSGKDVDVVLPQPSVSSF